MVTHTNYKVWTNFKKYNMPSKMKPYLHLTITDIATCSVILYSKLQCVIVYFGQSSVLYTVYCNISS